MSTVKQKSNKNDLTIDKVKEFLNNSELSYEEAEQIAEGIKEIAKLLFDIIQKSAK